MRLKDMRFLSPHESNNSKLLLESGMIAGASFVGEINQFCRYKQNGFYAPPIVKLFSLHGQWNEVILRIIIILGNGI